MMRDALDMLVFVLILLVCMLLGLISFVSWHQERVDRCKKDAYGYTRSMRENEDSRYSKDGKTCYVQGNKRRLSKIPCNKGIDQKIRSAFLFEQCMNKVR